jgi:hypothetical protein
VKHFDCREPWLSRNKAKSGENARFPKPRPKGAMRTHVAKHSMLYGLLCSDFIEGRNRISLAGRRLKIGFEFVRGLLRRPLQIERAHEFAALVH